MNLTIELKTRIYNHIGQVQQHLAELPPDEQREILQSIETHIYDALENRSGGNPTPDLLEAIIAEMDPPESYGTAPSGKAEPVQPTTKSNLFKSIGRGYALKLVLAAIMVIVYLVLDYMKATAVQVTDIEAAGSALSENIQTQRMKQPIENLITPGIGWTDYLIGKTRVELIQNLGTPQANTPPWLMRWDAYLFVDAIITEEGVCRELRFNRGFEGETDAGIKLGSSFQEARQAYGAAERVWTRDSCVIGEWPRKGIALWTVNAQVTQIIVRKPKDPSSPPFNNDPSVVGHWESIDFVTNIDQFDPAHPSWHEDLLLKELTFLSNGQSPASWKWTKGFIQNQDTWSRYELKQIGDETYLFTEWMSGDVTIRGQCPNYYVFKRGTTIERK